MEREREYKVQKTSVIGTDSLNHEIYQLSDGNGRDIVCRGRIFQAVTIETTFTRLILTVINFLFGAATEFSLLDMTAAHHGVQISLYTWQLVTVVDRRNNKRRSVPFADGSPRLTAVSRAAPRLARIRKSGLSDAIRGAQDREDV